MTGLLVDGVRMVDVAMTCGEGDAADVFQSLHMLEGLPWGLADGDHAVAIQAKDVGAGPRAGWKAASQASARACAGGRQRRDVRPDPV
jgi:hypothetical protein